jgi:hypothetical protein
MFVLRCLVALACALLCLSGFMLQIGPRDAVLDVCPWILQFASSCPAWLAARSIPPSTPLVLYALSSLGMLFVILPLFRGFLDQPPEATLELFIQRGRDLHERCRKEGDQAVMAEIGAWTEEVSRFLRRLGHRYVVAFGDFAGIQLFASQYDTAASMEIRQRLQRLSEFLQKFRSGGGEPG